MSDIQQSLFAILPPPGRWRIAIWPVEQGWHLQAYPIPEEPDAEWMEKNKHWVRTDERAWGCVVEVEATNGASWGWRCIDGDGAFGTFAELWFWICQMSREPGMEACSIHHQDFERIVFAFAEKYGRASGQAGWMLHSADYISSINGGSFIDPGPPPVDAWSDWQKCIRASRRAA